MGNASSSRVSAPHSPPGALRRGKKITGCPCFLSEQASTWEALTLHDKFRPYVLRHLLDEGFICSVLEHGQREHALGACEGVLYYKYMEDDHRGLLLEKLESWRRAAGAGVVACEGLNAESAFAELQLARPLRVCGFLPTLQRRLAVLRELGTTIAEEHRSRCRPFLMRMRAPPPPGGGQEQGDVRLALTMNAVALQSLSTLASLATVLQNLPSCGGNKRSDLELIRAPFAMLADMLTEFPAQSLFKYWSPAPADPEKRVPIDAETATASCAASVAHLAVTGGMHVGWKSTSTGSGFVTWQVALSEPAKELTSVSVQWGAGDPTTGTDQHTIPLALSIEASVDGGKVWHGITGGDGAIDVAIAHKAAAGSSQHRYPVSLLVLRRRFPHREADIFPQGGGMDAVPAVTHIRLKMKGPPSNGSAGALRMYDVAINARDPVARPSDVMTVLRQVQAFLLAQHSQDPIGLQEYILRALIGVCQASCALEFELDLVRVYMDMERAAAARPAAEEKSKAEIAGVDNLSQSGVSVAHCLGEGKALQGLLSTLVAAASRAKRQACRQDRERVIRDAGFDPAMSSKWVVISEGGQLVSSADSGHSHSLVHQCLRRGTWSWVMALERESSGDETTCVGVAVHPVTNSCYEDSHQMWMVRCYSGETYSNGGRRNLSTCKIHPLDSVRLTLNGDAGTLSLEVNGVDQGVVFSNVPSNVHPAVCFYGVTKSVRLVELKRVDGESDSDASDTEDESDGGSTQGRTEQAEEKLPLLQSVGSNSGTSDVMDRDRTNATVSDGPSSSRSPVEESDAAPVDTLQSRKRSRKRASRREARCQEEAVAAAIQVSVAESSSGGLLASLANFAQWHVPRFQPESDGDHKNAAKKQAEDARMDREWPEWMAGRHSNAKHSLSDAFAGMDVAADDSGWGVFGSGERHVIEGRRRISPDNMNGNQPRRHSGRVEGLNYPLRSMARPRHLSAARIVSTTTAGTDSSSGRSEVRVIERRRIAARARAVSRVSTADAARAPPAFAPGSRGKPLPLEEPYVLQPTGVVFHKLYDLLVRSLADLTNGEDTRQSAAASEAPGQTGEAIRGTVGPAVSKVLSLLQIMRANFCRLVDAHVDPAEVGVSLDFCRQRATCGDTTDISGYNCDSLLPNILRSLQGIMLQPRSDPLLRRATVDTFSSGLPLLMPRVEDRLHLLLALVQHLRSQKVGVYDPHQGSHPTKISPSSLLENHHARGISVIPRERVALLRNLLQHFSRTECVLELLALFEDEETERDAVSDLLELMLTSLANKACPGLNSASSQPKTARDMDRHAGIGRDDGQYSRAECAQEAPSPTGRIWATVFPETRSEADLGDTVRPGGYGRSYGYRNRWEQLVAIGAGGTTLNFTLLDTCQQHLLYMVLNRDRMKENPHELLLCQYGQCLLQVCCRVLSSHSSTVCEDVENHSSPWWQLVGVLLPPFVHALCLCADRPRIAEGMLPSVVCLSGALSKRIARNPTESTVASMAEDIMRQTQLANPEEGLALAPSGWHPVRASFEVDKDCMTSFAISEDGQLYSALTSSNTCALVDVGVSHGKAAWEFLLEDDTPSDECSVFGVATKPLYSRCYNSSPYLRMRRAYNGVLYDQGRQLPVSHNLPKVHPGDVLRCEVDMGEGTVRFRVNGEKQDGGFDGVEGEVFPCAGSYRSGVTIRLLKMEIMGGAGLTRGGDEDGAGAGWLDPTEISWAPAPCSKTSRGGLVSIDKKAMELRRMSTYGVRHRQWTSQSSARAGAGCVSGDPDIGTAHGAEPDAGTRSPTAVPDNNPAAPVSTEEERVEEIVQAPVGADVTAAGAIETADPEAWDWVTVRATRGFRACEGKHAVEMEVTPVGTGRRRVAGNPRPCKSADRTSLRRYPMSFGLCSGDIPSHDRPVGLLQGSWGWWTDGSLRAHGEVVTPTEHCGELSEDGASEALYGAEFLPLKPCDVITMIADTFQGTLRYLVNGVDAGVAFGPPESGAVCHIPAGEVPFTWGRGAMLFPSCSLTNDKQVVQLRPAGTLGTQLWPLSVDLHKTVASLAGRFCATMVSGTPQDEAEVALEPWLRSPLLSGGVQASENIMEASDWHRLGRRSWSQAWNAEREGHLIRTRSVLTWGDEGEHVVLQTRRDEPPAPAVAAEDVDRPHFRSGCRGEFRLKARVAQATRIPRGLVLWPEDPRVRLTAVVDGRNTGSQEEVLSHADSIVESQAPVGDSKLQGISDSADGGNEKRNQTEAMLGDDKVRVGQKEHVFVVQAGKGASVGDGNCQDNDIPSVSLRVEVLVGTIVTASGEVDVRNAWEVILAKSSSMPVVLRLKGGGEISLAMSLELVECGGGSARENLRRSPGGIPKIHALVSGDSVPLHGDSRDSSTRPEVVCLQRFLGSIASWGTQRRVRPVTDSACEDSHVSGPAEVSKSESDDGSEGHRGSDEGNLLFPNLVEWLERSHPDPPFLRMALEKTGNYSFPFVEAPFVAALLKHSGLVDEAFQATKVFSDTKGSDVVSNLPLPTKDMTKLWGRVRQLRAHLRTQRQHYKVMAADRQPREASVAKVHPVENVSPPEDRESRAGSTEADEKDRVEPYMEEKRDSNVEHTNAAEQGGRRGDLYPVTFTDLCAQGTERANFLLELAPSTVRCASAAAEGTSVLMHHLAEELSDMPTPPPAKLQSRLLRWRSEDRGKERWKGVVDVLRVQSQLRRCSSMSHRPRAKSLGSRPLSNVDTALPHENASERNLSSPCIREGQVLSEGESLDGEDGGPAVLGGFTYLAGESGCASGDESDVSGDSGILNDATAASAALQACTMYVITGGAVAPPRTLKATLRTRTARAAMRAFGLEALAALIRTLAPQGHADMSTGAQSAVQGALVFLRPAFRGLRIKGGKGGNEVEITHDEHDPRHHYLKGLEGCSAGLLTVVQSAFEDLYGLLRTLLDHSLQTGQPGLAHVLMTTWALDFESRDFRFLAQESGILPTLQAMVTLTNTAGMASSALARLGVVDNERPEEIIGQENSMPARQRWTPWSLDSVREGFVQGKLMARDLARHISCIPAQALPSGFLEQAELHGSAADILRRHSMASLMRRYSALLCVHLNHAKAQVQEQELYAAEERKRLEKVAKERVADMIARGVPVLDERDDRKAPEVHLTALCSWATVPLVESVACTFARGLTYVGKGGVPLAEVASVVSAIAESGNYYEVTVMNPGDKTTIGVGLADPNVFPATKQMPGWVEHSYGYHGDDGRKFGRGKTDSIWPTWVDGDVVGCGFDPARGAIWYTRNGKLLGDGFVGVHEPHLVPVVGFHSNGESVRVNFGVSPFVYEGVEVMVAPVVLAERERLQHEAREHAESDDDNEGMAEEKAEGELAEEKDPEQTESALGAPVKLVTQHSGDTSVSRADSESEPFSPETLAPSIKVLQRGASSLFRFLVAVSMRQAAPSAAVTPQDPGLQGSPDNPAPLPVDDAHQVAREPDKIATPTARVGVAGSVAATSTAAAAVPLPMRERSMYGTPFKHMQAHVDILHQDIFDLVLRELRLGALSLHHILDTSREREVPGAREVQPKRGYDIGVTSSLFAKLVLAEQNVKPEMRRSFSHSHSRCVADGGWWRSPHIRRGLDVTGLGDYDKENTTATTVGLVSLEVGEVEPHVFRQLTLLCSVRRYVVTRVQLAHPSALRTIISLLRVGSPRVQRCSLLLLGVVLPTVEPAVVDSCLPTDWVRAGRDTKAAQSASAKSAPCTDQEAATAPGRCPHSFDGLVGVLFKTVRKAYAPVPLPVRMAMDGDDPCGGEGSAFGPRRAGGGGVGGKLYPELLAPGCDQGFGGGLLDLCLAEQCSSLLRELYTEPAWKELIARTLLISIRTAACAIRDISTSVASSTPLADSSPSAHPGRGLHCILFDAVAAVAIIAGSSGVLYPGAAVRSKSGARGTVVLLLAGDAEAGVVFDGQNVEGCEKVLVRDLEVVGAGFQADPDTPAQPVVAQLLSLLGALLASGEVTASMRTADPEELNFEIPAIAWSRLLSQTLVAVLQLSVHCSDAVVAACQEGDVVAQVLPKLLQMAVRPIPLPALITTQDYRRRWRAAQSRMLSALHLGDFGLRTLQPIRTCPLPPPEAATTKKVSGKTSVIAKQRYSQSQSGSGDTLSAEESRGESLTRPQRLAGDRRSGSPDLASARWARNGGRGRVMAMGDAHRSWGRGWGSATHGRRTVGAWGSLDWGVRSSMEEDDETREGSRRRLLRSDLTHRVPARGRRATSVESRLEPRRSATRVIHERMRGFTEPRDEETGALLVEFNDGTDEAGGEVHIVEGGSAGSADSADTSQDGDEEEITTPANGDHATAADDSAVAERLFRSSSPDLTPYIVGGGSIAPGLHCAMDERVAAVKPTSASLGFPLSHVLEFGRKARGERQSLGTRLSEELGVPYTTALAALEAFGEESERARHWLPTQQAPAGLGKPTEDDKTPLAKGEDRNMFQGPENDEESGAATDAIVIDSLIGASDGDSTGGGGEPPGVPSAEEGLNLWGPNGEEVESGSPDPPTLAQRAEVLCEHDLTPALGIPRPSLGVGGPTGTVSSSFLVREADLLAPGSLLMIATAEGYAPGELGPCATVAKEIWHLARSGQVSGRDIANMAGSRNYLETMKNMESTRTADGSETVAARLPEGGSSRDGQVSAVGLVMDGEEVLVEMLDAETGLCLGKRVPIGELRHSASFFGRKLNVRGTTVMQLIHHTDTALCMLRARSLLVRLIHSLHTPAIAAAGGPRGLLNLTRLLAAQDLAKGSVPASVWSTHHAAPPPDARLIAGAGQSETNSESIGNTKIVTTPAPNQDPLLRVLWRKVMQSPEKWISDRMEGAGAGDATLGETLAQEVLDSFNSLTATPQVLMSGDGDARLYTESSSLPQAPGSSASMNVVDKTLEASTPGKDSIVHESLHPLCTPLSYGGHIEVDPTCYGMVIKVDSRSRTATDLLRLQFFSSKGDMLNDRDPLRVMHGHVADRSARARAKGMEFFKIEEADSASFDATSSSLEDALPVNVMDPLAVPRPLVRQSSTSTTASVGSSSPVAPRANRRAVVTSQSMGRGLYDVHRELVTRRWVRFKDASVSPRNNAFRSFVLPGVTELWFRFDAPPGAEKPPLQIIPLAGSLDLAPASIVRANSDLSNDPNMRSHSEQDEEFSQEDMGLKALFSFFCGEQTEDDVTQQVGEAGSKSVKSTDSGDRSGPGEVREHGKLGLPGCLVAADDVRLTSGKWYYEVTIETLPGVDAPGDCLVRVGWAHLNMSTAIQRGGDWKRSEESLPWHAGVTEANNARENDGATTAEGSTITLDKAVGELQRKDSLKALKPLRHTISWLFDSKANPVAFAAAQLTSHSGDAEAPGEAVASLSTVNTEGIANAIESSDLSQLETEGRRVAFPILGSDRGELGIGLGEQGFIWLGARPRVRASQRLAPTDVVGCAVDIDSGSVWFSLNGQWTRGGHDGQKGGGTSNAFDWDMGRVNVRNSMRPCLSVRGKASVSVNFGATPFKHAPPGNGFRPVILRDAPPTAAEGAGGDKSKGADKSRGAADAEDATQLSRKQSKSTELRDEDVHANWGFRFVVDPLRGVQYRVVRELELICRLGVGGKSGPGSSGVGSQVLSIWRPKSPVGWYSIGDVTSHGVLPPAGAVVVRADTTGCLVSKPAKFRVVHQDKTSGYVVWRPVPRKGQVSLGDFACAKKASKAIMAGAVRCVASWAVERCPVVECLWREEKQSGSQAIWSVQNGLGTFFGSLTGGRLSKREVTQGPQSRAERQKRKKKKKKKKGSGAAESSEDEEGERVKLRLGVGEGWALRGVSASCITNEWCQESDVITGPLACTHLCESSIPLSPANTADEQPEQPELYGGDETGRALAVSKPHPSVSWASWLLSFLLNHRSLRRLAMRASLFRTLVAYLRSPGAPHRLRVVPLLTLLVRSHAEFEDGPPPLEDLDGLVTAVLQKCDRATYGRGPSSAVWRPGDCPGGMQLETKWASEGLLLLTDLVTATRRAQDSLRQRYRGSVGYVGAQGLSTTGSVSDEQGLPEAAVDGSNGERSSNVNAHEADEEAVRVILPLFGTRMGESPVEEEEEDEVEEVGQTVADRILWGKGLLCTEDRALLEADLRNAVLPDTATYASNDTEHEDLQVAPTTPKAYSPSRCLHHLLEIGDTLRALRDGWPSPVVVDVLDSRTASQGEAPLAKHSPPCMDPMLCEAWMDAVAPAAVVESEHPFREGAAEDTLHFPGAEELVVFLDPRSSMEVGTASLVLEAKDKIITLAGRQESPWGDVIMFSGSSLTYRFVAEADGEHIGGRALVDDPEVDDWGFRFTIVAKGPVWEVMSLENELCEDVRGDASEVEAHMPGALSLLVEFDQIREFPPDCDLDVQGFTAAGIPVHRGLLTQGTAGTPIYVRGEKVRVVPLRRPSLKIDASADSKEGLEDRDDESASSKQTAPVTGANVLPISTAQGAGSWSDNDAMPDADAKLERLPSNTPVLRPWGEAAGVERRWRSHADDNLDTHRMPLAGASYVSNTATVEVGDSDVDSKDGSTNSAASSIGERPMWARCFALNDAVATGLPALSAMSSASSEAPNRGSGNGIRTLRGVGSGSGSGHGGGNNGGGGGDVGGTRSHVDRPSVIEHSESADSGDVAGAEGNGGGDGGGDAIRDDAIPERASTTSSRRRACAGAKDVSDDVQKSEDGKLKPAATWKWAVKVRAAAMPRKARMSLHLQRRLSLGLARPSLEKAREWMRAWTPEMDMSLLELLGAAGTKLKEESSSGRVTDTLNPWCCRLTRAEARFQQQRLAAVPAQSMHIRAALLLRLNDRIERVLPVIDLASRQEDSLGWQLREMNHLVLPHIKNAVLEAALAVTQGPGDGVAVTLDNIKAMMSRDRGDRDLASSQCVFAQAYRQLCDTEAKVLRTVWDGERVFQINFVGEDGVDAGGVFREGMSRMVEDLFSPYFDLLIQCPNGRQAIGQNNEKFVPNPQHSSPLALSMLRFVGRLMGLSLRTRLCLPFQLPGMIWKRILGLQVNFEDLRMVDTIICQFVTAIRTCEDDGLASDEEFRDKYGERLFFTCTGSDGVERELAPGGAARRVTFHNRWTFCRMVEEARTHEFDAQAEAIAEGLSDIVPMKVLRLFTAKQLEIAVAGEPQFDVAFWKEHTEYKGYRADDDTVDFFWKVIESMSAEDQSGFVRFAWGRSRLPPKTFWRVNMKLLRRNTSEDSLPVSHTCFFSVELPPYSTEELMRKGLLTAIHFGMGGILNA